MTALRIAIGLTIYFVVMSVLVLILSERAVNLPRGFELTSIFIADSLLLLMPVRWGLMLALIVRSVRAQPLKFFPSAPRLQVALAVTAHALLGLLSFLTWFITWMETKTGDRVFALVLYALLPSLTIAWVARRQTRALV